MNRHIRPPRKTFFLVLLLTVAVAGSVLEIKGAVSGLPEGAGSDVVSRMCGSSCHEISQVTQIRASADRWWRIVDEMVARGATGSDEDIETVVYYLASHFGVPVNVNQATKEDIETHLYLSDEDASRIVSYRKAQGIFKGWEDLQKVPGIDLDALREVRDNITFE